MLKKSGIQSPYLDNLADVLVFYQNPGTQRVNAHFMVTTTKNKSTLNKNSQNFN